MPDPRLRIARGLLFTVGDGVVRVWQPRRREHTPIVPQILALLLQFGDGRTVADAADDAGLELDDAVAEAVDGLVKRELLVAVDAVAAPPQPRRLARERIDQIVDTGSFELLADGPIITGFARIDDRKIAIAAWEPDADGGIESVLVLQERVLAEACPIVYVLDRFSIGRNAGDFLGPRAVGRIYANQARLSGLVPQIAIVEGALWRPAALLPVGCDVVIFVEGSGYVHIADTELVKELTGETVTPDALGGARMHAEHSGLGHLVASSTLEAATLARRYLAFMPTSSTSKLPVCGAAPPPAMSPGALDALVPVDTDAPFAISELVRALLDDGSPLELRPLWARELSTTLGRLEGMPVGVIANCSQHKAGILTVEAADKAARFITLCDAYGLPVIFLVDVLGFAVGRAAERAGIERAAGRLFGALATATVPKLTLAVRRAHTAGLFAMCGPAFDPDAFLALPTASLSIVNERSAIAGISALERQVDDETKDSLRGFVRSVRPDPSALVQIVVASQARRVLAHHLTTRFATPAPPRGRRTIPS
jgi:methylmalonyl-CoA decarboxylase subunit alpha